MLIEVCALVHSSQPHGDCVISRHWSLVEQHCRCNVFSIFYSYDNMQSLRDALYVEPIAMTGT